MQRRSRILAGAVLACLTLSACAHRDKVPQLMHFKNKSRTPNEFTVLPTKPLTLPPDMKALPDPTPGGANITDPTPEADAVAALGGNPDALKVGKPSAGNAGLMNYAARFGSEAGIRDKLAAEDLDWRRKHDGRLLERMFSVNVYTKAYKKMSLDEYAEWLFWQKRGVKTVGAPPQNFEIK